jgi:hypothetical protein
MAKAKARQLRKLTLDDVEFRYEMEIEDSVPVEGNAQCSDNPEDDLKVERDIIEALNRGYVEAWCQLTVYVTWNGFTCTDHLGAVSFEPGLPAEKLKEQVLELIDSHGMKEEALGELQKLLEETNEKLQQIAC